ncbi:MAG: hypothetical protein AAGA65_18120 [Actinomycetota bacterium]
MTPSHDTNEPDLPVARPRWEDTDPDSPHPLSGVHQPSLDPVQLHQGRALPPAVRAEVEALVAHAVTVAHDLAGPQPTDQGRARRPPTGPELVVALMVATVMVFATIAVLAVLALAVIGS